ncbi:uncharacterized protein [Leptinotarsa decemlineata]|uniref:uncharacterized protein n=1 Tax=Leptinotarsa decemlineata TaxID=7539 RepID=UPI003D30CED5
MFERNLYDNENIPTDDIILQNVNGILSSKSDIEVKDVFSNGRTNDEKTMISTDIQFIVDASCSIFDIESRTNSFDIDLDKTSTIITCSPDLYRFCEDIESQVINFASEDMLELNNCVTETENSSRRGEKFENEDRVRSEDFADSNTVSDHSDVDSLVDNCVEQSRALRRRIRKSPILPIESHNGEISDEIQSNLAIPIATMTEPKGARRKWDKTFLCIFCKKSYRKLPRHWYMKHPEENEVSKILRCPSNSKEKKKLIAELQNKGIALSNTHTLKTGEGFVVPKRRPRKGMALDIRNYISCRYCNQLFLKSYIDKHEKKRCTFNGYSKG